MFEQTANLKPLLPYMVVCIPHESHPKTLRCQFNGLPFKDFITEPVSRTRSAVTGFSTAVFPMSLMLFRMFVQILYQRDRILLVQTEETLLAKSDAFFTLCRLAGVVSSDVLLRQAFTPNLRSSPALILPPR